MAAFTPVAVPAEDPRRRLRLSDSERDVALELLREQYAEGRLTLVEFEERASQAAQAKFVADLDGLFHDLPVRPARGRELSAVDEGFRAHLNVYLVVNALLVLIWLITMRGRGYFWPIWPMLGWGVFLAMHWFGARNSE